MTWLLRFAQALGWVWLAKWRLETSLLVIWSHIPSLYCGTYDIFPIKDELMELTMGTVFGWSSWCLQVFSLIINTGMNHKAHLGGKKKKAVCLLFLKDYSWNDIVHALVPVISLFTSFMEFVLCVFFRYFLNFSKKEETVKIREIVVATKTCSLLVPLLTLASS